MHTVELATESVRIQVIGYGARLSRVQAPDRNGEFDDVVLGFDDELGWRADRDFLGATIGRFANRIAAGRFEIDGVEYRVPCNEPGRALHGGPLGFDRCDFVLGDPQIDGAASSVTARRISPDGEMGFPGELTVAVTFTVDGADLRIDFEATTTAATPVSLTNHAYWNLGGTSNGARPVDDHLFTIAADTYLPIDANLIPVGAPQPVQDTVFDLRERTRIGSRLRRLTEQTAITRGIDHTYVLDQSPGVRPAATVVDPKSGRSLQVLTDQPGLQCYTGNFLDGTKRLRNGNTARQGDAFCLEPQQFPDAPNRVDAPGAILLPGETYRHTSIFRFGVVDPD